MLALFIPLLRAQGGPVPHGVVLSTFSEVQSTESDALAQAGSGDGGDLTCP